MGDVVNFVLMRKQLDELPNRIRHFRKLRGWSQGELAERVGLANASAVSKLENGEHELSFTRARQLARVLGCAPSDLMLADDFPYQMDEDRRNLLDSLEGATPEAVQAVTKVAETINPWRAPPLERTGTG